RMGMRGVIVTSRAEAEDYDFVSRFFAPGAGVDEDPVTGSAHCCLAPYWSERLGKDELVGYQASARGGRVGVRCRGERVFLSGQAVTVLRGELID
ncbi:MAG: PhzF family phenazine biosynthesis protein, partial [Longimicrobiales bacterium]